MGLINVDHSNHQSSSAEPFKVQVTQAGGQSSLVQLGQGSRGTFSSFGPKTHAGLCDFLGEPWRILVTQCHEMP